MVSKHVLHSVHCVQEKIYFDIFIQPLQWGKTSWTSEMDEERVWIDQTIEKTIAYVQNGGQFDMSIQVTIPNEFERMASGQHWLHRWYRDNKGSTPVDR